MKVITIQDIETSKLVKFPVNDKTWDETVEADDIVELFRTFKKLLNQEINNSKTK